MKIVSILLILLSFIFADDRNQTYNNVIVTNKLYIGECATCHMAYQPQFLPKRSWNKLMDNLNDHFRVDATFDKNDEKLVRSFLLKNASDSKNIYGHFSKFSRSISNSNTPIAISQIPKFKREHRRIPKRVIAQKEVKTVSNCMACHQDAQKGLYRERNIFIPNYGRWDD